MKKEFLQGYRTVIFYILATTFFCLWVFYGRGLSPELWLTACAIFLGKNYMQSKVSYDGNSIKVENDGDAKDNII